MIVPGNGAAGGEKVGGGSVRGTLACLCAAPLPCCPAALHAALLPFCPAVMLPCCDPCCHAALLPSFPAAVLSQLPRCLSRYGAAVLPRSPAAPPPRCRAAPLPAPLLCCNAVMLQRCRAGRGRKRARALAFFAIYDRNQGPRRSGSWLLPWNSH
jgi:hypothetical protein